MRSTLGQYRWLGARHRGDVTGPAHRSERRSGVRLGLLAGTLGIGCCVGPTVLALTGLASASTAVAMGNRLYRDWGWAFKLAAVCFALAAILIQRRRARSCPVAERPSSTRTSLWLAGTAVGAYALLYAVTKGLSRLA